MVRLTDRSAMTIAVVLGRKATKQTNKTYQTLFPPASILTQAVLSLTWTRDYKTFSCLTQLRTKFQLLNKTQIPKSKKKFLALSLSDVVFIMLIMLKFQ